MLDRHKLQAYILLLYVPVTARLMLKPAVWSVDISNITLTPSEHPNPWLSSGISPAHPHVLELLPPPLTALRHILLLGVNCEAHSRHAVAVHCLHMGVRSWVPVIPHVLIKPPKKPCP